MCTLTVDRRESERVVQSVDFMGFRDSLRTHQKIKVDLADSADTKKRSLKGLFTNFKLKVYSAEKSTDYFVNCELRTSARHHYNRCTEGHLGQTY